VHCVKSGARFEKAVSAPTKREGYWGGKLDTEKAKRPIRSRAF